MTRQSPRGARGRVAKGDSPVQGLFLYSGRGSGRPPQTWLFRQAKQLIRSLRRRLRQGDPVHQRLLPSLEALAADCKRLESERRHGLAQGWPGEAARAEASLATMVASLRTLHRTLAGATRLDRARLDSGLLVDLDRGMAAAAAASREVSDQP